LIHRNLLNPADELDTRIKLVLVFFFILTTALTPTGAWPVYILLQSLVLAAAIASSIPLTTFFKRSLVVLPFVMAAIPLLFTIPGPGLGTLGLGSLHLTISQAGLTRFITIFLKSWISIQSAILITATSPIQDILKAMRAFRLPRIFVEVIGLMWRYLFLFREESQKMIQARSSRSGESPEKKSKSGGTFWWRGQVTGGMAGSLFLRSLERSNRVYHAMLSRGYDGEFPRPYKPPISAANWIFLGFGLLILSALMAFGVLFW
jgi:cobalt/nickel transport system permease protein